MVGILVVACKGADVGLQKIESSFFNPHLYDTNVSLGLFGYHRLYEYDQWKIFPRTPLQLITGGNVKLGFGFPWFDSAYSLFLTLVLRILSTERSI